MGGKDNRTLVGFRATDDELKAITSLIKASGLSKQDFLLRAALGNSCSHTPCADSSTESSPGKGLVLLSAGAISNAAPLKGVEVEKALLSCKAWWVSRSYYEKGTARKQVFWKDGWIWLVGKTANGSSKKAVQLMECSEVLFLGAKDDQFELSQFKQAICNWNELKAIPDIELAGGDVFKWGESFYEPKVIGDSRTQYGYHKRETLAAIKEAKRALELENEVLAQELAFVSPMPTYEDEGIATESTSDIVEQEQMEIVLGLGQQQLTVEQFKAKLELDDRTYGAASSVGRDGWESPDDGIWFLTGTKNNKMWSRASIEARQLVLDIV